MPEVVLGESRPLEGDVSFECRLVRIEAFADTSRPDQTKWNVRYGEADEIGDVMLVVPTAQLRVAHEGTWGQTLAIGLLRVKLEFLERTGTRAEQYVAGFIEEMWDLSRRSLNMLAAHFDVNGLELPLRSPATTPQVIPRQDQLPESAEPLFEAQADGA